MANIMVEKLDHKPVEWRDIEIVERKGLGHPDYIADAIAEAVSRELSKYYIEKYGTILHHNVDKVLVVGGQVQRKFGGGVIVQPIRIIVAGRVTTSVVKGGSEIEEIPVGPLILKAAKDWLGNNFRFLDPATHVIVDYEIGKGSADLTRLIKESDVPLANDTSLGLAFYPLTETEKLVLTVERKLNSPDFKKKYPFAGEDVKVMGLRVKDKIKLTVAVAIIASEVKSMSEYLECKEIIRKEVLEIASEITDKQVEVQVNTADDTSDPSGKYVYLVVTGTSAEHGDDGMTGRGNRVNGLITPMRPMSLEATAGKNPVSHVGKIFNALAYDIAKGIYNEVHGIREVYVYLLSQIGKPLTEPQIAGISVLPEEGASFNTIKYESEQIAQEYLRQDNLKKLTERFVKGEIEIF